MRIRTREGGVVPKLSFSGVKGYQTAGNGQSGSRSTRKEINEQSITDFI